MQSDLTTSVRPTPLNASDRPDLKSHVEGVHASSLSGVVLNTSAQLQTDKLAPRSLLEQINYSTQPPPQGSLVNPLKADTAHVTVSSEVSQKSDQALASTQGDSHSLRGRIIPIGGHSTHKATHDIEAKHPNNGLSLPYSSPRGRQDGLAFNTPSSLRASRLSPMIQSDTEEYLYSPLHTPNGTSLASLRSSPLAIAALALAVLPEVGEDGFKESSGTADVENKEVIELAQKVKRTIAHLRSENSDLHKQLETSKNQGKVLNDRCAEYAEQIVVLQRSAKLGAFYGRSPQRKPSSASYEPPLSEPRPKQSLPVKDSLQNLALSGGKSDISVSLSTSGTQTDGPKIEKQADNDKGKQSESDDKLNKVINIIGCVLAVLESIDTAKVPDSKPNSRSTVTEPQNIDDHSSDDSYNGVGSEFIAPTLEALSNSHPELWTEIKKIRLEHEQEHAKLLALSSRFDKTRALKSEQHSSDKENGKGQNYENESSFLASSHPASTILDLSSFDGTICAASSITSLASSAPSTMLNGESSCIKKPVIDLVPISQLNELKQQVEEWRVKYNLLEDESKRFSSQNAQLENRVSQLVDALQSKESSPVWSSDPQVSPNNQLNSIASAQSSSLTPKLACRNRTSSKGHARALSGHSSDFKAEESQLETISNSNEKSSSEDENNTFARKFNSNSAFLDVADVRSYLRSESHSDSERRPSAALSKTSRSSTLTSSEVDAIFEYTIQITTPLYSILDSLMDNGDIQNGIRSSGILVDHDLSNLDKAECLTTECSTSDKLQGEEPGSIKGLVAMTGNLAKRIKDELCSERALRRLVEKENADMRLKLASVEAEVKVSKLVEEANRKAELAKLQAEEAYRNATGQTDRETERAAWSDQKAELMTKSARLEGELASVHQQLANTKEELNKIRNHAHTTEIDLIRLQAQYSELQSGLRNSEEEIRDLMEREKSMQEEITNLKSVNSNQGSTQESELKDAKTSIILLTKKLEEKEVAVENIQKLLAAEHEAVAAAKANEKQSTIKLNTLRKSLEESISKIQKELQESQAINRGLKDEVDRKERDFRNLELSQQGLASSFISASKGAHQLLQYCLMKILKAESEINMLRIDPSTPNSPYISRVEFSIDNTKLSASFPTDPESLKTSILGAVFTFSRNRDPFEGSSKVKEIENALDIQLALLKQLSGGKYEASEQSKQEITPSDEVFNIELISSKESSQSFDDNDLPPLVSIDLPTHQGVDDSSNEFYESESGEKKEAVSNQSEVVVIPETVNEIKDQAVNNDDIENELIIRFASIIRSKVAEARVSAETSANEFISVSKKSSSLSVAASKTSSYQLTNGTPRSPPRESLLQNARSTSPPRSATRPPLVSRSPHLVRQSTSIGAKTTPLGSRTKASLEAMVSPPPSVSRHAAVSPPPSASPRPKLNQTRAEGGRTRQSGVYASPLPQSSHTAHMTKRAPSPRAASKQADSGEWEADEYFNSKEPPKRNARVSAVSSTFTAPVGAVSAAFAPSASLGSEIIRSMQDKKKPFRN